MAGDSSKKGSGFHRLVKLRADNDMVDDTLVQVAAERSQRFTNYKLKPLALK